MLCYVMLCYVMLCYVMLCYHFLCCSDKFLGVYQKDDSVSTLLYKHYTGDMSEPR
jgi:hypothetical protein